MRLPDFLSFTLPVLATTGILLSGLLMWHIGTAVIRLIVTLHTPQIVAYIAGSMAKATRERQPWGPLLRGLCLHLPWPWPWRLQRAAEQLDQGVDAASVLETSALLPRALRHQASQALRANSETFSFWCDGLLTAHSPSLVMVRQVACIFAQVVVFLGLGYFLSVTVMPKFEQIFLELGLPKAHIFSFIAWFMQWKLVFIIGFFWVVVTVVAMCARWGWRQRRQVMAGRLLVIGSSARLPEAALGTAAQSGMNFAELATAAGWQAANPNQLARAVAHKEFRQLQRAAWLPALCAAIFPILAALPVGALVIGIMHLLISMIYHIEALG